MPRTTGAYRIITTTGEQVRAFVPAPLPPDPPLQLDGPLQRTLEGANIALGRLDGISGLLPNPALFLYSYVRKEAVLSSQIEGTQSSLSNLLLFELEEAPGAPLDDVREVSNYVAAFDHGLGRLRGGFPLSNRLIREIHGVLLARGRGSDKDPGEFRRSQVWIGGTRPGNANFVPPPADAVQDCMTAWEPFLHDEADDLPVLVRAGLAHAQFETIHPFLDGNGRIGRLLVTLLLCQAAVLRQPLFYLSLYLKEHRATYYELLNDVRRTGDWEAWIGFFLEGVKEVADHATETAKRLSGMFQRDRDRLSRVAGRRTGSAIRVHGALKERPILSLRAASAMTRMAYGTAASAMDTLVKHEIARELTGQRRNRLFAYDGYLAALDEGIEVRDQAR